MQLAIDIGNTSTKLAVFEKGKIIHKTSSKQLNKNSITMILNEFPETNRVILASVANTDKQFLQFLSKIFDCFIELNPDTKLPFEVMYKTPLTLGNDRIAAVSGASNIFPKANVLVIDIGTAITYDIIDSNNTYVGGNISPGLNLRFKSLHEHTDRLPLLNIHEQIELIGKSTEQAIISGVQNGVKYEIEGVIKAMKNQFEGLKIIITGGHANMFAKMIKSSIFVQPNLVLIGLNRILEYNAKNI